MEVLAVRIPPSANSSTCLANGHDLQVGDSCVVDTERGLELGIVTRAALDNPRIAVDARLPSVIRPASRDDEERFAHKVSVEAAARDHAVDRIRELGLQMKLGHVEMQLDGKKMLFYFTAEGRVDFRVLVRDLSRRFDARIELRQIGSRDDAMMQGGCGTCGETLCCSTWMTGFVPVSIKMAKAQGLSLNPSKISGMCGRLVCYLKYEYDGKPTGGGRGRSRGGGSPRSEGRAKGSGGGRDERPAQEDDRPRSS
jgi:cell fate regulator YaaT (PSP1 superfamily)